MAQQQNWQSYSYPSQPSESKAGPALGAMGGGCAVLIGLILLLAFFLPWTVGFDGDESAFDTVKEDLGADNTLGETLYKVIFGSTALAGCGSVVFGLGLAGGALLARRNAAFSSWMATSIGAMVVLAAFLPCWIWTFALLGDNTDEIKIGVWISLGSAAFLGIAAFIGLIGAFLAQRQRA